MCEEIPAVRTLTHELSYAHVYPTDRSDVGCYAVSTGKYSWTRL